MAELFGFSIKRARSKSSGDNFTTPTPDDGSIEVAGGGFFSSILDECRLALLFAFTL